LQNGLIKKHNLIKRRQLAEFVGAWQKQKAAPSGGQNLWHMPQNKDWISVQQRSRKLH